MSASTSSSSPSAPLTPPPILEASSRTPVPDEPVVGELVGNAVDFGEARYVLKELLGLGGMGEVYLARRVMKSSRIEWGTSELAAIKVLRRDVAAQFGEDVKEFVDEARLHLGLSHPNVVPVRGVTEADGTLYMLMEYLEGYDLRILLKMARGLGTRLSEGAICNILAQVADGLDYVHRATDESGRPLHIVHRDVSPSNIRVTTSGDVKLMDFGVAKHDAEWREQTRSSWSGFKGKPMYLSPEQANHEPLDGRSDLFAVGSILAECLIGRRLFERAHEAVVLHAIKTVSPEHVEKALQGAPEGLKAICHRLLARDREDRFQTGKEVAEALRSWAYDEKRYMLDSGTLAREVAELAGLESERLRALGDAEGAPSEERQSSSQEQRRPAPSRILRIAITGILIVLVLVAVYFLRPRPPPAPLAEQNPMFVSSPQSSPVQAAPVVPANTHLASVAKCLGVGMVSVLTAACPPVHVKTNARAGDCTMEAPLTVVDGHRIPEVIPVFFVSLNGQKCKDAHGRCEPAWPTCDAEPCPAGDGELVMMTAFTIIDAMPKPDEFLQGALFYGKAHVVDEPAIIRDLEDVKPRRYVKRMFAHFTEMRLKNGKTVPICGVLFQGRLEEGPTGTVPAGTPPEEEARLGNYHKEGIPVLDASYYGVEAVPSMAPYIRLYGL